MSCFTCTGAVNHEFETDLSQIRIVKSCEKELKQKDDKTFFFQKMSLDVNSLLHSDSTVVIKEL